MMTVPGALNNTHGQAVAEESTGGGENWLLSGEKRKRSQKGSRKGESMGGGACFRGKEH